MQVCVCGWYFKPEIYSTITSSGYDVTCIAHKPCELMKDISYVSIPNVGLEFGAYDYFVKNEWDKRSGVLFMHDDVDITDVSIFDKIANCGHDQAFIFRDEADGKANQNFHGRMLYCSEKFLRHILDNVCDCPQAHDHVDYHNNHFCSSMCAEHDKETNGWGNEIKRATYGATAQHKKCINCGSIIESDTFYGVVLIGTGVHTGFWFDPWNYGHHAGKPPIGVRHYNDAIYHLALQTQRAKSNYGLDTHNKLYFDSINLHKRGVKR